MEAHIALLRQSCGHLLNPWQERNATKLWPQKFSWYFSSSPCLCDIKPQTPLYGHTYRVHFGQ